MSMSSSQSTNPTPKEYRLRIAGTSIGGSSYAHRIIEKMNEMKPGDKLIIIIGSGCKQDSVERSVYKSIVKIKHFLKKYSTNPVELNISVQLG